jgi:LacI family transcriptional regulator
VFSSPGGLEWEDTRLLSYRLAQSDRPDAIFVLHDMSVPAIVDAVLRAGLEVPNDVAVVGFGNDLPLSFNGVGLTTVAMNWRSVATVLVERLLERLAAPTAPYRRSLVPTRLIVRGSCGAPREMWSEEGYEISSITVTGRMPPPPFEPPAVTRSNFAVQEGVLA